MPLLLYSPFVARKCSPTGGASTGNRGEELEKRNRQNETEADIMVLAGMERIRSFNIDGFRCLCFASSSTVAAATVQWYASRRDAEHLIPPEVLSGKGILFRG